jgi:ribonuclease P protein component
VARILARQIGDLDEADIPTVEPAPPPDARVSQEDEHSMGTGCPQEETAQGPQPPDRVGPQGASSPRETRDVRHLFRKQERIRRRKDFQAVYFRGNKSAHGGLAMHALPTGHTWTRLGLSVGRKFGRAVERNGIKRRLREIFRLCKHQLKPGHDVVITVRREAAQRSYHELEESVTTLLARLNLFQPGSRSTR